ncbi:MAG: PQQ-like beta-propeller repeat protein, partial [Phycisphaerales bacterium]|nr:PQQ-like beta-propeller repeat protein [Phycisphaerales bacterium]
MPTRRLDLPAIITSLALVPLAGAGTTDWNVGPGGNSARDCRSAWNGPATPELLWSGSLSAIVSQQAVIDGDTVFAARIQSFTIPTGTTIVAHDLDTGRLRWTTQLPSLGGDEWRSRVSGARDGRVYATRAGNTNLAPMYALSGTTGGILWTSEDLVDESTTEGVAFASDGDLIVGNFDAILRIDGATGATVWSTPRSCPTTNGCLVSVFGERGYYWEASPTGPRVTSIDLVTGAVIATTGGIGGGFIEQLGVFVGPDGTIYAPRSQNNPVSDFLVAISDTGDALVEKWSVPIGYMPFATMGVGPDGSVYTYETGIEAAAGTDLFRVLRLDPLDGSVIDQSEVLPYDVVLSARMAIDASGRIFLTNGGFSTGRLFSFDADLTLRWTEVVTGVNVGGPALGADGTLIVCGTGTNVRAYRAADACPADLDGSGGVGPEDLASLLSDWGRCPGCASDLDGDGTVGPADL